ncbi:MAG: hypothetical protein JOY68_00495 [Candidatus Dormibacteraeota bacterium]|nr:hypothetical protein [Candidatus Dormibacteraeota bacterium]MBV8446337.1 hypothetical protein [Candidatus Dormibacteraeota bacterium]
MPNTPKSNPPWYNPPELPHQVQPAAMRRGHAGAETPHPARRRVYATVALIIAAAAAAAITVVEMSGYPRPHELVRPGSAAGESLQPSAAATTPEYGAAVEAVQALGTNAVVAGVYSSPQQSPLVLAAGTATAPVPPSTQLLQTVAMQLATEGQTVQLQSASQTTSNSVTYACAPVAAAGTAASTVCVWGDVDVIGLIIDAAGGADAASAAASLRAALED